MIYVHRPIKVEAVQVTRPFRSVTKAFPRSHMVKLPSGAFSHFRLVDAPEGANKAYEGDWIVRHSAVSVEVLPDHLFVRRYAPEEKEPLEAPESD